MTVEDAQELGVKQGIEKMTETVEAYIENQGKVKIGNYILVEQKDDENDGNKQDK